MLSQIRMLAIAAALLLGCQLSARADVIITVDQVGLMQRNGFDQPTPIGTVAGAQFVVTDEAYAQGLSLSQRNGQGFGPPYANLNGMVGLQVSLVNITQPFAVGLTDFTQELPIGALGSSAIELASLPGSLVSGILFYGNRANNQVLFTFNGSGLATGSVFSDSGECFLGCTFSGRVTVSVPEPASALILGTAVVMLGLGRRRRAAKVPG
ncbi:MAG: exosortase interaction domain protein [Rubritepida sp.]|nr:exosortase interaction domain protein [Rubritepida sp.]